MAQSRDNRDYTSRSDGGQDGRKFFRGHSDKLNERGTKTKKGRTIKDRSDYDEYDMDKDDSGIETNVDLYANGTMLTESQ